MKEIKFRVWDNHYNRWEERPCAINKEGILFIYNVDSGEWFEPSHTGYTVEWYTGRKDKNGKEIYEGDKVSSGFWGGVVEFVNGAFKIVQGGYSDSSNFDATEIIGNVHQPVGETK